MRPSTGDRLARRLAARKRRGPALGVVDDFVLKCHRLVDRFARWAWLGAAPPAAGQRRFLIVQIDGLSRQVLDLALTTGQAPSMARLLRTGRLERREMSVGLPSSTPAFQAAAMYGVQPDIPGFHYLDKRAGLELHFPRLGVADLVEQGLSAGRRGILEGGACYGCVFTGGASESLITFARLLKPTRAGLPLLRAPLSVAVLGWAFAKCLWRTAGELLRFVGRAWTMTFGPRPWRWLGLKLFFSVWVREYFTLAVSGDLYRGVRGIYVNYLDYDVFAHSFGPSSRPAMRALRRVDGSIGQLARVLARLPEVGYDLYVLSDHGQTESRPFAEIAEGRSIDQVVRAALAGSASSGDRSRWVATSARRPATSAGDNARGVWQRFLNHFERPARGRHGDGPTPATVDDAVRVIAAGPNAFVYFTDSTEPLPFEEIERRYPGVAARLSTHPGIGLVLARSGNGICWWRGQRVPLDGSDPAGPFAGRADRDVVLAGLRTLMAMPSAGDLVLYGIGAPVGDVSFIDERGAHAGPSERELLTFLLHPPAVGLPTEPLSHPAQLYPHFLAYAVPDPVDPAAPGAPAGARRDGRHGTRDGPLE